MTLKEKRMKAAAIAVGCMMQQDSICSEAQSGSNWDKMGINRIMNGREFLQRKGRSPKGMR